MHNNGYHVIVIKRRTLAEERGPLYMSVTCKPFLDNPGRGCMLGPSNFLTFDLLSEFKICWLPR